MCFVAAKIRWHAGSSVLFFVNYGGLLILFFVDFRALLVWFLLNHAIKCGWLSHDITVLLHLEVKKYILLQSRLLYCST